MLATGPTQSQLLANHRPVMHRWYFTVACMLVVAGCAFSFTVATASGDEALDALVADYRAYELPMPSDLTFVPAAFCHP